MSALYADGLTQGEIATRLETTQKVIWRLMGRHGITPRVASKRDQRGSKNTGWRGDAAGYKAMHLRVTSARGAPSECEQCKTTTAKRFEWASLSGNYGDVNDYIRLCCSCHHKMDNHVRNLGSYALRKEGGPS